jgi:predicted phage gp36 major capsid-like protein
VAITPEELKEIGDKFAAELYENHPSIDPEREDKAPAKQDKIQRNTREFKRYFSELAEEKGSQQAAVKDLIENRRQHFPRLAERMDPHDDFCTAISKAQKKAGIYLVPLLLIASGMT